MYMKLKLLAATAITLVAAATATVITDAPAFAQGEQTCTGTAAYSYDPPLMSTPTSTTVTAHFEYPTCAGLDLTIASATIDRTASLTTVCGSLPAFGSLTVQWSNGNTSVLSFPQSGYVGTFVGPIETLVGTGTVMSGEFNGATVVQTEVFQRADVLACPRSSLSATSELDITGL
jgi:hypothetical protein